MVTSWLNIGWRHYEMGRYLYIIASEVINVACYILASVQAKTVWNNNSKWWNRHTLCGLTFEGGTIIHTIVIFPVSCRRCFEVWQANKHWLCQWLSVARTVSVESRFFSHLGRSSNYSSSSEVHGVISATSSACPPKTEGIRPVAEHHRGSDLTRGNLLQYVRIVAF